MQERLRPELEQELALQLPTFESFKKFVTLKTFVSLSVTELVHVTSEGVTDWVTRDELTVTTGCARELLLWAIRELSKLARAVLVAGVTQESATGREECEDEESETQ